ncbi:MAG: diguanylate cyclase [Methanosarcinales archaeon]|nr:diguanylate cyclase [Methanosarcinales archaeon]
MIFKNIFLSTFGDFKLFPSILQDNFLREISLLSKAVLVETDAPTAREIAERMRGAVASLAFDTLQETMTISLGVVTLSEIYDIPSAWETLLKDADQHLYRTKREGRNRVVMQT